MPASSDGRFHSNGYAAEPPPQQAGFEFAPARRSSPQVRAHENLFFMIEPDEVASGRIAALMDLLQRALNLPGYQVAPDRFHISLHGLGSYTTTPPEMVARAKQVGAALASAPFDVTLDRVMSFQGHEKMPLVLTDAGGRTPLTTFHQEVGDAIADAGIGVPVRSAFRPHVTLMYPRAQILETDIDPITWTVRDLVLVKNLVGQGRHIHLGRWPLRG